MSKITTVEQTGSQLGHEIDLSKFLLGNNSFISGVAGSSTTLLLGMVMGRISASGLLIPCVHGASDGSEKPVGIAILEQATTSSVTEIQLVNKGIVDVNQINFSTASTLESVVDGRRIKDHLNDLGLELSSATELTAFYNS
jgi:hypothetical protein